MGAPVSDRGTAKQEFLRRCSKAMHAEHADGDWAAAPPVTRCRQRVPVEIECMIDGLGAARKHQRVLRPSPCCICVEILALRCRGPMLAHPLAKPTSPHTLLALHLGTARVWRPVLVVANGCAACIRVHLWLKTLTCFFGASSGRGCGFWIVERHHDGTGAGDDCA